MFTTFSVLLIGLDKVTTKWMSVLISAFLNLSSGIFWMISGVPWLFKLIIQECNQKQVLGFRSNFLANFGPRRPLTFYACGSSDFNKLLKIFPFKQTPCSTAKLYFYLYRFCNLHDKSSNRFCCCKSKLPFNNLFVRVQNS